MLWMVPTIRLIPLGSITATLCLSISPRLCQNTALRRAKSVSSSSSSTLSSSCSLVSFHHSPGGHLWHAGSWAPMAMGERQGKAQLELVEMLVECGTHLLEAEQVQGHHPTPQHYWWIAHPPPFALYMQR